MGKSQLENINSINTKNGQHWSQDKEKNE